MQLNFYTFFRPARPVDWNAFARGLKKTAARLKASNIPFIVVIHPVGAEETPNEYIQAFIEGFGPLPPRSPFYAQLLSVIQGAGVERVDLWPTFIAEEQSASHRPIFGTFDGHFTEYGRALVAESVAKALERLRPWAQ
ncbi:MAG: hypothetical protein M3Y18_06135 [Candidatus Eremiobacteraeota bacterium]|nr:hypothetical protein [Candidatus Eremiobacteraeota bacterium]